MKLGGENRHKSKIRDWHNRIGSALFGGVGGGCESNSEKFEKKGICNLRMGDQILMTLDFYKDSVLQIYYFKS